MVYGPMAAFMVEMFPARIRATSLSLPYHLGVGVLGGFTTFSSFSLETALMIERKDYAAAFGYVAGSVIFAIGGLFAGLLTARRVFA